VQFVLFSATKGMERLDGGKLIKDAIALIDDEVKKVVF
jgi:hypothetical protein